MQIKRLKLTEATCENAPPDAKLWDTEIKGFGLFAGKTKNTLYHQKHVHGKTTRTKLGAWPETRLADACYEAAQLVAQYASGAVAKRLLAKLIPTLGQATDDYLARPKLRSDASKKVVRGQMHHHLKAWLKVPLGEISKGDCVAAHSRISFVGERGANHVMKSFRCQKL